MQVTYIGVNHRQGVSEKTGNSYSICELIYAVPDESSQKKNDDGSTRWVYTAYGCKPMTLPCDPGCIHDFKSVQPFDQVVLSLQPNPQNPARNQVVGFQK